MNFTPYIALWFVVGLVTAGLALDRRLDEAIAGALDYVQRAIAEAPGLGSDHGPLNHTVTAPPPPPLSTS